MSIRKIKRLAAKKLGENWGECVFLTLIFASMLLFFVLVQYVFYYALKFNDAGFTYTFSSLVSSTAGIAILIAQVLVFALMVILELFFYRRSFALLAFGNNPQENGCVCHDMRKFSATSFVASLLSMGIRILAAIPSALAGYALYLGIHINLEQISTPRLLLFMTAMVMLIVMLAGFVYVVLSLVLVPFVLLYKPETTPYGAVRRSWQLMRGRRTGYLAFRAGFLKFLPLCLLVFPLLLILPYYMMSGLIYADGVLREE